MSFPAGERVLVGVGAADVVRGPGGEVFLKRTQSIPVAIAGI